MPSNDNDFTVAEVRRAPSDPHGRAALLLVESLIHGLCANAMLSIGEAVAIAERAVNVQHDQAEAADDSMQMWQSHALLSAIAASLSVDDKSGPPSPRLVT